MIIALSLLYVGMLVFLMWYGKWVAREQARHRICPVEIARAKNKKKLGATNE